MLAEDQDQHDNLYYFFSCGINLVEFWNALEIKHYAAEAEWELR